jgi:hypothetical protein
MSLRKAVGDVELVDARTQAPTVRRLVELGYDLNEGMAAIYGGKVYYGKDAVVLISSLTGDRDWMGRVIAMSLRNPTRATFLYPLMKLGHRIALRMLGKPLIWSGFLIGCWHWFPKELSSEQFGEEHGAPIVQNRLVCVITLYMAIVRMQAHPFRLRRQIPLVWIAGADQSGFNFSPTEVSTIVGIRKLWGVSDLPTRCLATAEACRARRRPQYGTVPVGNGAL